MAKFEGGRSYHFVPRDCALVTETLMNEIPIFIYTANEILINVVGGLITALILAAASRRRRRDDECDDAT